MRPLIITRPERQSVSQRWGYGLLTVLFWGLFGYFIRPLVTLLAWTVGYWRFHDVMIEGHGINHLARLLMIYGAIIGGMSLSLIAWSIYNLLRYGHNEKRVTPPDPTTPEMLAEYFMIDPDDLCNWQSTRRLVLDFDPSGRIVDTAQSSPEKNRLHRIR
jgi:poly-beta-1,6-N-acetyl-D-glucosamine biosynthesis protein PgaD